MKRHISLLFLLALGTTSCIHLFTTVDKEHLFTITRVGTASIYCHDGIDMSVFNKTPLQPLANRYGYDYAMNGMADLLHQEVSAQWRQSLPFRWVADERVTGHPSYAEVDQLQNFLLKPKLVSPAKGFKALSSSDTKPLIHLIAANPDIDGVVVVDGRYKLSITRPEFGYGDARIEMSLTLDVINREGQTVIHKTVIAPSETTARYGVTGSFDVNQIRPMCESAARRAVREINLWLHENVAGLKPPAPVPAALPTAPAAASPAPVPVATEAPIIPVPEDAAPSTQAAVDVPGAGDETGLAAAVVSPAPEPPNRLGGRFGVYGTFGQSQFILDDFNRTYLSMFNDYLEMIHSFSPDSQLQTMPELKQTLNWGGGVEVGLSDYFTLFGGIEFLPIQSHGRLLVDVSGSVGEALTGIELPTYAFQLGIKQTTPIGDHVLLSVGVGYEYYLMDGSFWLENRMDGEILSGGRTRVKGKGQGWKAQLGVDVFLSKAVALGADLGYRVGKIDEIKEGDLDSGERLLNGEGRKIQENLEGMTYRMSVKFFI